MSMGAGSRWYGSRLRMSAMGLVGTSCLPFGSWLPELRCRLRETGRLPARPTQLTEQHLTVDPRTVTREQLVAQPANAGLKICQHRDRRRS